MSRPIRRGVRNHSSHRVRQGGGGGEKSGMRRRVMSIVRENGSSVEVLRGGVTRKESCKKA